MTDTSMATTRILPLGNGSGRKLIVIIAMTALADWLLYRRPVGISVVLAIILLETGVLLTHRVRAGRELAWAAGALLVALLPFVESPSVIAFGCLAAAASYFALTAGTADSGSVYARSISSASLLVAGPFQVFANLHQAREVFVQRGGARLAANAPVAWVIPILFAGVFLALFALANPLIEEWLVELNLKEASSNIDLARVIFWLAAISVIWPFICMSRTYHAWVQAQFRSAIELPPATIPEWLLGDVAVLRSLILFNLLFAVQTALDINYLWGGAALPYGMSYADYAHRGAYALIFTALLAAGFVTVAMRPGCSAERSPLIRGLMLLWIGQNVMLVVSSILRLDLYVATYSLTYLRAAAFIWMLLVMIGLVLIVVRIMLYRPNSWLISMNLAALALTIYACGFINFSAIIATYNVEHSREISGKGEPLDVDYLVSLGPQAIPALDAYVARQATGTPGRFLIPRRDAMAASHINEMTDWRGWSFRGFRLKRYLEGNTGARSSPTLTRAQTAAPADCGS